MFIKFVLTQKDPFHPSRIHQHNLRFQHSCCSCLVYSSLQQLDPPEEEQLSNALQSLELELGKLGEIPWLYHILQPNDEEVSSLSKHSHMDGQVHTHNL